jgi:hypothetical protein
MPLDNSMKWKLNGMHQLLLCDDVNLLGNDINTLKIKREAVVRRMV